MGRHHLNVIEAPNPVKAVSEGFFIVPTPISRLHMEHNSTKKIKSTTTMLNTVNETQQEVHCSPNVLKMERRKYAMYVWKMGFDPNIVVGSGPDCFLSWDKIGSCFTHTWNTEEKRKWLWATCNTPNREISTIFLSDVKNNLESSFLLRDCESSGVHLLRKALSEGHEQVPGLKIYALFAVSDEYVSERLLVPYVVWYNDHCARSNAEKFDGVAVNNEAYNKVKSSGDVSIVTLYLDRLQEVHLQARKQVRDRLLTHYSIGWHWGRRNGETQIIPWRGKSVDVLHHMIDIFDSIDVQVASTKFPTIKDRMHIAGLDYASTLGKQIYATLYTNKADSGLCHTSFFPETCRSSEKSEAELYNIVDQFVKEGLESVQPCIHYFRGVYSCGGNPDWPVHTT
ncbi:uncharacterized protein LOC125645608 isoform X3 [Ostrea edulis]|nr:uncharacterized protein LOC125645608 isoform X3 [Ostrea edulis]